MATSTDYCVAADVEALLQTVTFSTTTKPTLAQVNTWITDESNTLDGYLKAAGFKVPFSSTTHAKAFKWAKQTVALIVASLAESAQFRQAASPNKSTRAKDFLDRYYIRLMGVLGRDPRTGQPAKGGRMILLDDAEIEVGATVPRSWGQDEGEVTWEFESGMEH